MTSARFTSPINYWHPLKCLPSSHSVAAFFFRCEKTSTKIKKRASSFKVDQRSTCDGENVYGRVGKEEKQQPQSVFVSRFGSRPSRSSQPASLLITGAHSSRRGRGTRRRHRSDGDGANDVYSTGDAGYRLARGLTRGEKEEPRSRGLKGFMNDARLIEPHTNGRSVDPNIDNINTNGGVGID